MKFTLSTKPFADALNLGVIPSNVSKYYHASCLVQLTATSSELRINLEASCLYTEIFLKGSGDFEGTQVVFLDCLTLKQLVSTFEAAVTTIEFVEGGVVLHSGQSKFNLPSPTSTDELSLQRPADPDPTQVPVKLDKTNWQFIQDHQMFAVAMSYVYPVYTRVWVGQDGNVIAGDYSGSLFTFSNKSNLGKTCLLNDTAINLLTAVPDGATIVPSGKSYRISVKTDAFEYAAELKPQYEMEDGVDSYNSDIILETKPSVDMLKKSLKISSSELAKLLNQVELLASTTDNSIALSYDGENLLVTDQNVNGKIPVINNSEVSFPKFSAEFLSSKMKSIISHIDGETIGIYPSLYEEGDETVMNGVCFYTDDITIMLGSREES